MHRPAVGPAMRRGSMLVQWGLVVFPARWWSGRGYTGSRTGTDRMGPPRQDRHPGGNALHRKRQSVRSGPCRRDDRLSRRPLCRAFSVNRHRHASIAAVPARGLARTRRILSSRSASRADSPPVQSCSVAAASTHQSLIDGPHVVDPETVDFAWTLLIAIGCA
jgi:hypothetical protein